jgi:hypothetical protein
MGLTEVLPEVRMLSRLDKFRRRGCPAVEADRGRTLQRAQDHRLNKTRIPCRRTAPLSGYLVMGAVMTEDSSELDLLRSAKAGDERAVATLFTRYRERLKRMVALRLDRRLSGRVDASDVLQEAYLEIHKRFADWAVNQDLPFFLWRVWQVFRERLR